MSNNSAHQIGGAASTAGRAVAAAPCNGVIQRPQHHAAAASGPADHSGLLYDLSSFDPLQAHALQLTASAGLTNMLPPPYAAPAPTGEATSQQVRPMQNMAQTQNTSSPPRQLPPQGHHPQQGNSQQPSYYYVQPQNGGTSSLQPIAPASQQKTAPQAAAQSYILPATTQGIDLAVPQGYQQQMLPNGHGLVAAPGAQSGAHPGMLMNQHLQSVVANAAQRPAPLAPAINPACKREGQELGAADRQPSKKAREPAPSIVSSSTDSAGYGGWGKELEKPPQEATQSELDKMTPAQRRRYERNLREQQRSYKISQQIKELRDVLAESNVPFKPNKYSILLSVVDYIKQLQSRAIMLDSEHQKLITTIRQTNEMVNSGTAPSSADEMETANATSTPDSGNDNEMLFVQGLDYRSVFEQCPAALGIAALDGRILECNPEFQILLGFPRDDLLKQSLFNLVRNHQEIFRAMAEMLKGAETPASGGADTGAETKNCFWNGEVMSKVDTKVCIAA